MDYHMRWRHVVTCCRVMCAYYAYVTIRRALGVACFGSRHFVNTVSGQHFSAENKKEAAEFDSQHLPMHFRGVIWKIKSKSNFPVSFSLINAEMNLVGNYRTLRGLRTVNPEGLPSTMDIHDSIVDINIWIFDNYGYPWLNYGYYRTPPMGEDIDKTYNVSNSVKGGG